eukprot:6195385-Amphidinium_carterae.1
MQLDLASAGRHVVPTSNRTQKKCPNIGKPRYGKRPFLKKLPLLSELFSSLLETTKRNGQYIVGRSESLALERGSGSIPMLSHKATEETLTATKKVPKMMKAVY